MNRFIIVWLDAAGAYHFRSFDHEGDAAQYYDDLDTGVTKFLVRTEEQDFAAVIRASRSAT